MKYNDFGTQTSDKVQVGDSTTGTSTSTTYTVNSKPSAEYGWICPRCNRVNAPWKSQCDCSGNYWLNNWEKPYYEDWWKRVYCDSDTFRVHPETTTWKAPSSTCGSDSATVAKSDPNCTVYTTAHTDVVGGSDYWDEEKKCYTNGPTVYANSCTSTSSDNPWNQFSTLTNQLNSIKYEIEELKETK